VKSLKGNSISGHEVGQSHATALRVTRGHPKLAIYRRLPNKAKEDGLCVLGGRNQIRAHENSHLPAQEIEQDCDPLPIVDFDRC
jgi:hypothetical protein